MAEARKDWLGRIKGSKKEARANFEADRLQREEADRDQPRPVILDPKAVSGENWDAAKVLHTTLGGVLRQITPEDLAAFRHNIKKLQARFKTSGITARQVIDLAGAYLEPGKGSDRQRAKREIQHAVLAGVNRGELHAITNAGPDSRVMRHHVVVKFPLWDVAVAGADQTPEQAARWLLRQPLKLDCDCGRWRFFFRYAATAGGWNAGRPEYGYPKIRNPNLVGVACKHVVRVMTELETSPRFYRPVAKAIEKMRDKALRNKQVQLKQAEAEREAEAAPREIRSSSEQAYRRSQARAKMAARAAAQRARRSPRARAGRWAKGAAEAVAKRFGIGASFARKLINRLKGKG